ncbi:Mariner Mos1 transposase [Eumeta japonica]|uniref:Mariner Mos1 transposase n=1 Tax=Eumeta variegata TaxID=151549 RepID=A0A4C1Y9Y5_EUMVA|nr:Mariner Mos1 transposase [Eumeta japonica]
MRSQSPHATYSHAMSNTSKSDRIISTSSHRPSAIDVLVNCHRLTITKPLPKLQTSVQQHLSITSFTSDGRSTTATDTPIPLQLIDGASASTYELHTLQSRGRGHAHCIFHVCAPHALGTPICDYTLIDRRASRPLIEPSASHLWLPRVARRRAPSAAGQWPVRGVPALTSPVICFVSWVQTMQSRLPLGEMAIEKIITGNEKWIVYDENMQKRSSSKNRQTPKIIAKPALTRNKLMLCMWWVWKGIIHYELLPPSETINSDFYCQQLMRLEQLVEKKRPELIDQQKGMKFKLKAWFTLSPSEQGSEEGSGQRENVNTILPLLLALFGAPAIVGFSCGSQRMGSASGSACLHSALSLTCRSLFEREGRVVFLFLPWSRS